MAKNYVDTWIGWDKGEIHEVVTYTPIKIDENNCIVYRKDASNVRGES